MAPIIITRIGPAPYLSRGRGLGGVSTLTVTRTQLSALRRKALYAGDDETVGYATAALEGDAEALAICTTAIVDAIEAVVLLSKVSQTADLLGLGWARKRDGSLRIDACE